MPFSYSRWPRFHHDGHQGRSEWEAPAERLRERGSEFVIEPCVRFQGQGCEQATMFLGAPCGNAPEFKGCKDMGPLFAR